MSFFLSQCTQSKNNLLKKLLVLLTEESLENQQNCLLESPTGTGKTISILSACLSYMTKLKSEGTEIKLIYSSRTHSQLDQVVKEIKKLPFKFSTNVVASKALLCTEPSLQGLTNSVCSQK